MLVEQILLPGVVLPALIAATAYLLAWQPWRAGRQVRGGWGGPLALGAAYLAAHLAISGRPRMPAIEATEWLFHLAAVATLLALLQPLWRRAGAERLELGIRMPLFGTLLWFSLQPFIEHHWTRPAAACWLIGLLVLLLALAEVLDRLARLERRPEVLASLWILLSTGTALTLALSGTARIAQLCGATTAAVAVGWLLSWLSRRPALGPRAVSLAAVLLGGFVLDGYFFAGVPTASAVLLLGAAPLAWWAERGRREGGGRLGSLKSHLRSLGAAAVPVAAAVAIAALSGP